MRVLLVTRAATGGAARHVLDVVRGLSGRHEIAVLASPVENADYPAALEKAGARVTRAPIRRGADPAGDVRAVSALRKLIKGLQPEAIHAHAAKPGLIARAAAGRTPVVYSPHGFFHHYPTVPAAARQAALKVERTFAPMTAVLALCAEWEREEAERDGLVGRVMTKVIPNGVPAPGPLPDDRASAIRTSLGVSSGEALVVMAARLAAPKDPLTFLGAARRCGPAVRCVLVGDGPLMDRCRRAAPPSAVLAGTRTDLPDILGAADAAVLATAFEASPYFVLEAMAAALPVVATDLPATREALGDTGRLVPPGKAKILAKEIGGLLEDLPAARALGRAAALRVAERNSIDRMLEATESAWTAALR